MAACPSILSGVAGWISYYWEKRQIDILYHHHHKKLTMGRQILIFCFFFSFSSSKVNSGCGGALHLLSALKWARLLPIAVLEIIHHHRHNCHHQHNCHHRHHNFVHHHHHCHLDLLNAVSPHSCFYRFCPKVICDAPSIFLCLFQIPFMLLHCGPFHPIFSL